MKYLPLLLTISLFFSCKQKDDAATAISGQIVQMDDIQEYLDQNSESYGLLENKADSLGTIAREDTTRILDAAAAARAHEDLFDHYASVRDLNEAVRFRESVVNNTYVHPESSRLVLAQAYIKQHQFKKADSLLQQYMPDEPSKEMKLVMFDIAMELGKYDKAESLLNDIRNERDYNYLIRAAKWNDYKGRLDNTISHMENALELADQSGNSAYQLWSNSNIADYYGHDGQIQKSYKHYLKTLELDPQNNYALKGIAWIAYSHDDNKEVASKILKTLYKRHPSPDYLNALAEINESEGNLEEVDILKDQYFTAISNPDYGAMYNTYLIEELLQGTDQQQQEALSLAKREVHNRSTPETYDLLGYALLINGDEKAALENHNQHVIGKTYEPVAAYHTALIYKANGMTEEVADLKEELLKASYELGPVMTEEIRKL